MSKRSYRELLRSDDPHYSTPAGAIAIGLIALVLIMAVGQWTPWGGESGRVLKAEFASANQVSSFSPVRVDGVDVGKVEKVEAGPRQGTSVVTMRITNNDVVVHSDARAQVRWRTILGGNVFIDLQPGSPSAAPIGDGVIPASHTSSQAELDEITQIYAHGTAQSQRVMLRGLRGALTDPNGVGHTLAVGGPALRDTGQGLGALQGRETGDLRGVVRATAETVAGLGRDPARLRQLVDGADRTLAVTDRRRRELAELIALAPAALDSTRSTMATLETTLEHLDPLVTRLRVAAPDLAQAANAAAPALARTQALLHDIRPLLRAAGPTLTALKQASPHGVSLIRGLDPTIARLNGELLRYLDSRDSGTKLKTYESIGPFFAAIASVAAPYTATGHILQFAILPGANSVLSLSGPTARSAIASCRAGVPARARSGCAKAARAILKAFGGLR